MRIILTFGLAALALAGCHRQAKTDALGGSGEGPPQMTITTNEGTAAIRIGQNSGGLPFGLPPYPGAQTQGSIDIGGQGTNGAGRVIGFATSDPPDRVVAFYTDAARRAGFTISATMAMGPVQMVTAQRGENEGFQVTATGAGGQGTHVEIMVGTSH